MLEVLTVLQDEDVFEHHGLRGTAGEEPTQDAFAASA